MSETQSISTIVLTKRGPYDFLVDCFIKPLAVYQSIVSSTKCNMSLSVQLWSLVTPHPPTPSQSHYPSLPVLGGWLSWSVLGEHLNFILHNYRLGLVNSNIVTRNNLCWKYWHNRIININNITRMC